MKINKYVNRTQVINTVPGEMSCWNQHLLITFVEVEGAHGLAPHCLEAVIVLGTGHQVLHQLLVQVGWTLDHLAKDGLGQIKGVCDVV